MTPSQLKALYQDNNPNGHFFDQETMRHWGDTMKNYSVHRVTVRFCADRKMAGESIKSWKLTRRRAVKYGMQEPAYFDDAGNILMGVE